MPDDSWMDRLEGFDVAASLRRVGGKPATYLRLLRRLRADQGDIPARTRAALEASDLESAEGLAHGLKGVAGNLGATAVHTAAATLNETIRAGDRDGALAQVAPLEQALDETLALLDAALPADEPETAPATPTLDAAALGGVLDALDLLLQGYDGGAREFWDELRPALPAGESASGGRIDEHLAGFDYDAAREELAGLRERLASTG